MDKLYILTICLMLQPLLICSQSELFVFGNSGDFQISSDDKKISWTMGEVITFSEVEMGQNSMLAGFQQVSDYELTPAKQGIQHSGFSIYPNPTIDILNIVYSVNPGIGSHFLIYNSDGDLIKELPIAESINVSNLISGVYTIVLINSDKTEIQKFIITK